MRRSAIAVFLTAFGVFVLAACGSSPEANVTGTVTYREQTQLRPDTVVMVLIRDMSNMDTHATVIGDQYISTQGEQVPIAYEVRYNPDKIDESHTYGVFARIQDNGGKLLFVSDALTPVITQGNPTTDVKVVVVPVGD
jgi:putative lipoprotein